jgi:hypothetical protein
MKIKISSQRHRDQRGVVFQEGGNSLRAVDTSLIRVNSRAFVGTLLSASICVYLRLVSLFVEV